MLRTTQQALDKSVVVSSTPIIAPSLPSEGLIYEAKRTLQVLSAIIMIQARLQLTPERRDRLTVMAKSLVEMMNLYFDTEASAKDANWFERSQKTLTSYMDEIDEEFSQAASDITLTSRNSTSGEVIPQLVWIDGEIYQSPANLIFHHDKGTPAEWSVALSNHIKVALQNIITELHSQLGDHEGSQAALEEAKESIGIVDGADDKDKGRMNMALVDVQYIMPTTDPQADEELVDALLVVIPNKLNLGLYKSSQEALTALAGFNMARNAVMTSIRAYGQELSATE